MSESERQVARFSRRRCIIHEQSPGGSGVGASRVELPPATAAERTICVKGVSGPLRQWHHKAALPPRDYRFETRVSRTVGVRAQQVHCAATSSTRSKLHRRPASHCSPSPRANSAHHSISWPVRIARSAASRALHNLMGFLYGESGESNKINTTAVCRAYGGGLRVRLSKALASH